MITTAKIKSIIQIRLNEPRITGSRVGKCMMAGERISSNRIGFSSTISETLAPVLCLNQSNNPVHQLRFPYIPKRIELFIRFITVDKDYIQSKIFFSSCIPTSTLVHC